jgi:hypothetical protein
MSMLDRCDTDPSADRAQRGLHSLAPTLPVLSGLDSDAQGVAPMTLLCQKRTSPWRAAGCSASRHVDNRIDCPGKSTRAPRLSAGPCPGMPQHSDYAHEAPRGSVVGIPSVLPFEARRLNIGTRRSSEPEGPFPCYAGCEPLTEEASRGGQASPRLRPVRPTGR